MPNPKTYRVTVSSPELDTLEKYLTDPDSPAFAYQSDYSRFLSVEGEDGLTNEQRLLAAVKTATERNNLIADGILTTDGRIVKPEQLPLHVGTCLYLKFEKVNTVSFLTEGIEVVSTDDVAWKSARLAELEADQGYKQVAKPLGGRSYIGTVTEAFPACTVWIWIRSLSTKGDEAGELRGELFDLTPFIQKLSTNVDGNGGNFQITLPPLIGELDTNRKWKIKKATLNQFDNGEFVSEGDLFDTNNEGEIQRNQFFFQNAIRANDLLFIRFETLELEKEQRYKDAANYYIDKSMIPNRIYDMIGLVDAVPTTINPAGNDASISILGRDLSKVFLTDGAFFYPWENSSGVLRVAGSTGEGVESSLLLSRVFAEGKFIGLFNFTSIENILKFLIQQLSNIEVVPDELFSAYGQRRNNRFNEVQPVSKANGATKHTPQFKQEIAKGIFSIIKLNIDASVSQRRVADTSYSTAQGALINFIHTACQMPLVEYYADTYGDQYHLIVRKPPYDQKALISLLEGKVNTETGIPETAPAVVDIESEDVLQEALVMNETAYSWYRFFPKGAMINTSVDYSTAILPALFFDAYAKIYGATCFDQSHPYIPYVAMSLDAGEFGSLLDKQAFNDLKYIVEVNQALPFQRRGTIICNGDRRIKVGNIIRYKPTGEIFFVDSVQQNFSINENVIDRTTTIQVSRGMVEQLIYGKHLRNNEGKEIFVSYFNLIDTRLNTKTIAKKVPYTEKVKTGTETVQVFDSPALTENVAEKGGNDPTLKYPGMVEQVGHLETYNSYPVMKNKAVQFINAINESGYVVIITSGFRSKQEQIRVWLTNRNNALPGHSRHERGLAIDINVRNPKTGKQVKQKSSLADWMATGVPQLAQSMGLQWGDERNIGQFGNYVDRVHFQLKSNGALGATKIITRDVFKEETKHRTVYDVDRDGVFSNFKVNQQTFNFFLKNLQFDPDFRTVTSRQVYNSDQEGTLPDVIITSTKKTKAKN